MADMKEAYRMYKGGFSCGPIVATFCSNVCGFDEKPARAALAGFAGGMHCGEACSAVIGAVYSLGMYCNQCEYNDDKAADKISKMTEELTTRFKDKHGSLVCRELSASGDMNRCGEYIETCTSIVTELVEADKKDK